MELDKIHKYISLNKQANGNVEVLYAGQPCLVVSEGLLGNVWRINPVFAKLTYGANVFEDIPMCTEGLPSPEEAIAAGLEKLYSLGVFVKEYDFPEDTYAATMTQIAEEAKAIAMSKTKTIMEAGFMYAAMMKNLFEGTDRSEFTANNALASPGANDVKKKVKIKNSAGQVVSSHDTEGEALTHWKSLPSSKGMKIVRESEDGTEVEVVVEASYDAEEDAKYDQWEKDVKAAHPGKDLKFKGRLEKGVNTTSAEVSGVDRSFGVWDHDAGEGKVFTPEKEKEEDDKIQKALKKDRTFAPKKA